MRAFVAFKPGSFLSSLPLSMWGNQGPESGVNYCNRRGSTHTQ